MASLVHGACAAALRGKSAEVGALANRFEAASAAMAAAKSRMLAAEESETQMLAVHEALDGLLETVYLMSNASLIAVDVSAVGNATQYIKGQQSFMIEYGNTDTNAALVELSLVATAQYQAGVSIKSMGQALLLDASNAKLLLSIVAAGDDPLDAMSLATLQTFLDYFVRTLDSATERARAAKDLLRNIEIRADAAATTLASIEAYWTEALDETSEAYRLAKKKVEVEGNLICGAACMASIVWSAGMLPVGCACYLQLYLNRIPKIKNEFESTLESMVAVTGSVGTFVHLATEFSTMATNQVGAIESFSGSIDSTKTWISGAQDVHVALAEKKAYMDKLDQTILACNILLAAF